MPVIMTPQVPLRPTVHADVEWSGGAGAEKLAVTVIETVIDPIAQTVEEQTVAEYQVDFSGLGADDIFQGVVLPEGVPGWCNIVVSADREADGTLTVVLADWSRPEAAEAVTQPLPWEEA